MGYLIDTGVWVDLERGLVTPQEVASITGDEPIFLSPISLAELFYGAERAQTPNLRQQRLAALEKLKRSPILRIDEATGEIFGRIAAATHNRAPVHRVQDLWLASQAIQHNFKFLTKNEKDFTDIPGLQIVVFATKKTSK